MDYTKSLNFFISSDQFEGNGIIFSLLKITQTKMIINMFIYSESSECGSNPCILSSIKEFILN